MFGLIRKIVIMIDGSTRSVVIFVITIYQKLFSFDHAFWANPDVFRVCIYQPSCSEYAKIAIRKHGLFWGGLMGLLRVISCNPLNKPRFDPVPDHKTLRRQIIDL